MPTCKSATRSLLAFFLLSCILLTAANLSCPHDVSRCCTRRFSLSFAYRASQHLQHTLARNSNKLLQDFSVGMRQRPGQVGWKEQVGWENGTKTGSGAILSKADYHLEAI